jgi:hypothetical protein
MPAAIDLTGQRFGRLTVVRQAEGRDRRGGLLWHCVCDCGGKKVAAAYNLRRGHVWSCGCLYRACAGESLSPEASTFYRAKGRCLNPDDPAFHHYGGRGIEFRFESFAQFLAELGPRPLGMSLDRIDNDGHYEPGNVRWANWREQANNRRRNRRITAFGETRTLSEWARFTGLSGSLIRHRLDRGLSAERTFSPVRRRRPVTAFGKTMTVTEWSRVVGMPHQAICRRLNRGLTPEEALRPAA